MIQEKTKNNEEAILFNEINLTETDVLADGNAPLVIGGVICGFAICAGAACGGGCGGALCGF